MATISTYVSGHTEAGDVAEFFQKQLLNAGERPIAFFDGVFYESHQERVGNIAYQDYLIYSDRAVYLWARGANKDFLDRFALGAVTINSRNKDNDFATLNLRIRREEREPVYVIFDMVEINEAEKINTLHTVIESIIENHMGNNFRSEVPDEIAEQIFMSAKNICPPGPLSFNPPAGQTLEPGQDSRIGYGQDLLEQYKASMGYASGNRSAVGPPYGGATAGDVPHSRQKSPGPQEQMPLGIPKGLEGVLPTDPEALKRIAANLKETIGDAPFKFRDQVMKDLQHIPNDVATVLSAVNELLSNIADNPKAERFVLNAIQTAVKSDGILGSMGKMLKLSQSFGPMGKKTGGQQSSGRSSSGAGSTGRGKEGPPLPDDDNSGTIRRKKVKIHAENEEPLPGASGEPIDRALDDTEAGIPPGHACSGADNQEGEVHRKKIKITTDETEIFDSGSSAGDFHQRLPTAEVSSGVDHAEDKIPSRKIKVKTEDDDIPRAVEEQLREALRDTGGLEQPELDKAVEPEGTETVRKKNSIRSESVEDSRLEKNQSKVYRTMESESGQEDNPGSDSHAQQKKTVTNSKSRGTFKKSK